MRLAYNRKQMPPPNPMGKRALEARTDDKRSCSGRCARTWQAPLHDTLTYTHHDEITDMHICKSMRAPSVALLKRWERARHTAHGCSGCVLRQLERSVLVEDREAPSQRETHVART